MSWDIFVQDFPLEATSVDQIPPDFWPASIGKTSEIIEKIRTALPTADFSDPVWGVIDGPDWSIEVNIGAEEPCHGFALHVRGGDAAVGAVVAILDAVKLRAVDSQTGEFFVGGEEGLAPFQRWNAYRDQVMGGTNGLPGDS
jgi:hypothetical protein